MTKSKLFLRNSAKPALLKLSFILFLVAGCSPSISPSYFREDITQAIKDTYKKEYKADIYPKLVGKTLWIYLPIEDMVSGVDKKEKPSKYVERFSIEENNNNFENGTFKLGYNIKIIPEKEKIQEVKIDDAVFKKINGVIMVLRRVLFSMHRAKAAEPNFICVVTADIKNGFQMKQLSYYPDLKKVSYGFIGVEEYQHRSINDISIEPKAVGDKEGLYLDYNDIEMADFIAAQIQYRIKLKFSKPEVKQSVDIDKEVLKIAAYTINIYGFKDFDSVELDNLETNNKLSLNQQAILVRSIEKRF